MKAKHLIYAFALFAILQAKAAWSDRTAGLPVLDYFSARAMGMDTGQWFITHDRLGRLFVGSNGLFVFDGQSWRGYPVGRAGVVTTLQLEHDRLWVGGSGEIGYFDEPTIGDFRYHSLVDYLPEGERPLGEIWGSAVVGSDVYFVGRSKLYRWDGHSFRIWNFENKSRLFVMTFEGETWIHHWETGLYRLTKDGPQLTLDRTQLPNIGILALGRDAQGLLLVSNQGFHRPGAPAQPVFDPSLAEFLGTHRVACYTRLRNGMQVVGTLTGGLMILSADGKIIRHLDAENGLPTSAVYSLTEDDSGYLWCSSADGIYRFEGLGTATAFDRRNGLNGAISSIAVEGEKMLFCAQSVVYHPVPDERRGAHVAAESTLLRNYYAAAILPRGLLLGRHGGLDFFDGNTTTNLYSLNANGVTAIHPSRLHPGKFWVVESVGITRLDTLVDGTFSPGGSISVPSTPFGGIREDSTGRLWFGTIGQGIFVHDPATGGRQAVVDPETGKPFTGVVALENTSPGFILLAGGKLMRANPDGTGLHSLLELPLIESGLMRAVSPDHQYLAAFKRRGAAGTSAWGQGLGVITLEPGDRATWRELVVPGLDAIGYVQDLNCSVENGRRILWLGGTEGMLRLDYETLTTFPPPVPPVIRLDARNSSSPTESTGLSFPFGNHRLGFRIFSGDYSRSKDWLLQTRLAHEGGDWSPPSDRRTFEFASLSEGQYRFEARTVDAAGQTSEPTVFTFRILPPWYRSNGAYAAYAAALAAGIWGLIRFRERQIRAQNERLENLVEVRTSELVRANAAKDEFLAGVSHEIRNPMNGVIGIAESLKTGGLDSESRRKFGLLRQCASHLSSLLEDILDVSKIQAGIIELEVKSFDVYELTDAVVAMTAADSEKYRIPVEVAISPGVPHYLQGDPRRIRQILLNFVSNALKFSGRGQVDVTVWCQPTGQPDRTEVIFAVSDDGPGISAEEQKKLFKRFERGAAAQHGRVPGTGLGLALCKGFAGKMGGRIWVESEPGHGSCFYFSAPFLVTSEPAPAPGPAVRGNQSALVVDDQEYNRIVLCDLLAGLGYTVQAAGTGVEALQLAEKHVFDLVFLDYDLPGMSGLAVARGIRTLSTPTSAARILATTAFSTPEKQAQCLAAGMNSFLGKPVTLERLRRALAREEAAPPLPATPPLDPLANLRLLATKKNVRFEDELALYLSELQHEMENLGGAVHDEDIREAAHYAHLLCGRCSFIYQRELEQNFRRLEEIVARGHWGDARQLFGELHRLAAALPVRLVSGVPVVPPE